MNEIAKENLSAKFAGFFRAIVKDNVDPKKYGRVKLHVLNVFDDIATEYLPWATMAAPLSVGSGDDAGTFNVPDVDSLVWCFFEQGDHNQPVYFAEAVDGVHGLPVERLTNYPNRRVMKTKSGIVVYVDDEDVSLKVTHPLGTSIEIAADGTIKITGGNVEVSGADVTIAGSTVAITGVVDIN